MAKPIALTKSHTVGYVLEGNREDAEEAQVVWQLRAVPFAVRMQMFNAVSMDTDGASVGSARMDVGRKFQLACRYGIAGWSSNLDNGAGEPLEWASSEKQYGMAIIKDSVLELLPDDVIAELANIVIELSTTDAHSVGK